MVIKMLLGFAAMMLALGAVGFVAYQLLHRTLQLFKQTKWNVSKQGAPSQVAAKKPTKKAKKK
jgi:hypothetical protein